MSNFEDLTRSEKLAYVIENLRSLDQNLTEEGIDLLLSAGEIEYAVVLARDSGMVQRAIQILVDAGDYLWAALIAKNAGLSAQSESLYRQGLDYYVEMEMYGRAISAATALKMPQDSIDALFHEGIAHESKGMDLGRAQAALDEIRSFLEVQLIGREDETSKAVLQAIKDLSRSNVEDVNGQRSNVEDVNGQN